MAKNTIEILNIFKKTSKESPNATLLEIGKELGVSKERVRQLTLGLFNKMNTERKIVLNTSTQIIFMDELNLSENNEDDLLYLFLLGKSFKYKVNTKYKFLYSFTSRDEYSIDNIFRRIKSELSVSKIKKENMTAFISKEYCLSEKVANRIFEIIVKEGYFEKYKNTYVLHPSNFKFLHEAITYIIVTKFNGYIDFCKDGQKLSKKVLAVFPDLFKDFTILSLSDRIVGIISESRLFTLAGKSTYQLVEDFDNNISFEEELDFIEKNIEEKGIFSIYNYYEENKENYSLKGIESLQHFYSLLRKKNKNENISFLRYPSISTKDLENMFDNHLSIREIYQLQLPVNLLKKDIKSYFGISHSSFVQFFN